MRTDDFDYDLPAGRIAQFPAERRSDSRLLVLNPGSGRLEHRVFSELPDLLAPGDLLVLNDSKVIPARLRAIKVDGGSRLELLLVEEAGPGDWWVMLRPGKRVRPGTRIQLHHRGMAVPVTAEVTEKNEAGLYRLKFSTRNILELADAIGEIPLPPYIERDPAHLPESDRDRYQTVYAERPGSVAAPTAGLHFTPELLEAICQKKIATAKVTLHVGLGTFSPVKSDTLEQHVMHQERFRIPESTANAILETRERGGRVVAVGTTTVRVLESAFQQTGRIESCAGSTRIFIYPPFDFRVVDALITNFHLPKSTLLMLVSAFASPGTTDGIAAVRTAYQAAIDGDYRFFSYGDAMLVLHPDIQRQPRITVDDCSRHAYKPAHD